MDGKHVHAFYGYKTHKLILKQTELQDVSFSTLREIDAPTHNEPTSTHVCHLLR
jgi:hypothetical protein